MRRPKWLNGWGKGENIIESSLLIDSADVKVVEASYKGNLLFIAIGTGREAERAAASEENETEADKIRNLNWKIFYDTTVLPHLMPLAKTRDFIAGIVSASAITTSVYNTETVYIASSDRPSKGNAPLLIDYEIAEKIEEAKKKKNKFSLDVPSPERE